MGAHDGMSADPPSEGESKSVRWEITRQLKGKDVRERTGFYTGLYLHLYSVEINQVQVYERRR